MKQDLSTLNTVFIAGATKCGSTTLWSYFQDHHEALVGSKKELFFFDSERNYSKGRAYFDSFFSDATGKRILVDASANYLYFSRVPHRIKRDMPKARLIFIFRNPVERTISSFWHGYAKGRPFDNIKEALVDSRCRHLVEKSRYSSYLQRFMDVFDREQMLFLKTDDLRNNAREVRKKCYIHAGISPEINVQNEKEVVRNPSRVPRSVWLQRLAFEYILPDRKPELEYTYDSEGLIDRRADKPLTGPGKVRKKLFNLIKTYNVIPRKYPSADKDTLMYLEEFFADDVRRLAEMTGLDLSSWANRVEGR